MYNETGKSEFSFGQMLEIGKARLNQRSKEAKSAELFVGTALILGGKNIQKYLSEFSGQMNFPFHFNWGAADAIIVLPEHLTYTELSEKEIEQTRLQLKAFGLQQGDANTMILNLDWTKYKLTHGGWGEFVELFEEEAEELYMLKTVQNLQYREAEQLLTEYKAGVFAAGLAYYNARKF